MDKLITRAIESGQAVGLYELRLSSCGPFVNGKLHDFERALADSRVAKSAQKRADTEERARRAGTNLSYAVSAMKDRMKRERKEAELFQVDDHIFEPFSFQKKIDVVVGYRWRELSTKSGIPTA